MSTFYYRQGGRRRRRRGLRGGGGGRGRERDAATRTRAARRGGGGVVGQGDGGAARCYVLTVASSTASKQGMNAENASYNLEKVSLCTLRHYNIKPRNVQQQAASTNDETEYLHCAITSVTLVWKLGFF